MEQWVKYFERYHFPLIYYAQGLLNNNWDDARDMVQDSFLSILENNYTPGETISKTRNLLWLTVRRKCIDFIKTSRRRKRREYEYKEPEELHEMDEVIGEVFVILLKEKEKLPTKTRMVIDYILNGKSTQEIAKLMNTTPSTVWNQKKYGITLLQKTSLMKYKHGH